MLDIVRANTKSVFTWLIVVGIVVVFAVNFGPGSLSRGGCGSSAAPYAARVNGTTIPASEWERRYRQLYAMYREQAGNAFTRELADQLGLPAQAMEQVVDHELVVQEAKRRGVAISRQELTRAVLAIPSFQEGGRFSKEIYEETTRQVYGSAGKYEAVLKDDLLYGKMMAALRETVKVSDADVRAAWQLDSDRASLSFVRFPLAAAEKEDQAPTDAEVKAFAEKETERVRGSYEENRSRFDQKRKVRVRHVLARVAPGASDDAARKKIDEARARLDRKEDFAKVASALSDDENTRGRGGELGFVTEGLFDEAFAKAALSLEPGQISEPVRTPSGWHLVQAEEVVPARQVPFEQARLEVARDLLRKDRAHALAEGRARAALDAARAGKSLADLFPSADPGKASGRKPVRLGGETIAAEETGPFSRGTGLLPRLGEAPEIRAAAFAAKAGEVLPTVFETPAGPVVAVVQLRETPDPAAFEAQRGTIEARLRSRKETQVEMAWLRSLRDASRIERNGTLVSLRGAAPEE